MNILFLSSEVAPFAKTGGLGDVSAALPRALGRRGHDVRVFMPLYSRIDQAKTKFRRVESVPALRIPVGGRHYEVTLHAAQLPQSTMDVFFVHCPALYGRHGIYTHDGDEHARFLVLQLAALEFCQRMRFAPHVVHCNDWQTALTPLYLKTRFAWDGQIFGRAKTVLTIHNLNYQGLFPSSIAGDLGINDSLHLLHQDQLRDGRINFLLHGILYASAITTVSPTYSREIRTAEYGVGLDPFLHMRAGAVYGILNGVDYGEWSPQQDRLIPHHFSPENLEGKELMKQALLKRARLPSVAGVPLFGIVSRLAGQKGFDLLHETLPRALSRERFQLIVLGSGERRHERFFHELRARFPAQVRFHAGFDNELAHWIEAGSDFFLMPSRYEPCGLNQMYSLKYGTVPVVRKTGGLADTVELWDPPRNTGTGIVFEHYDAPAMYWALTSALRLYRDRAAFRQVQQNGMAQDFSWEHQVKHYERLYAQL